MLEQKLEQDIKTALMAGDKQTVTTLRGLKSALLNVKVAESKRESGLSDDEVIAILSKEAKKRQESADLYTQGGSPDRAGAELAEKQLIEQYLPAQASEADIVAAVEQAITETGATDVKGMGPVMAAVKTKLGATADGALIARLVRERLVP